MNLKIWVKEERRPLTVEEICMLDMRNNPLCEIQRAEEIESRIQDIGFVGTVIENNITIGIFHNGKFREATDAEACAWHMIQANELCNPLHCDDCVHKPGNEPCGGCLMFISDFITDSQKLLSDKEIAIEVEE